MTDKYCVQQVLGSLLKKPQLLSQVDRYNLAVTDFYTKLEKYVFIAILGLYQGGAKSISVLDVENYLDVDAGSKAFFDKQNGLAYTQDILEFAQIDNFDYYYQKLKKINLLNDLQKMGFSTDEFYISDLTNPKSTEVNEKFEHLTAKDITDKIKIKILGIEKDYQVSGDVVTEYAVDGINDLIDYMDEVQDVGLPIQGTIYNQVINGAQPGTLTIRSASSGLGKTRSAIGDACFLAYPIRYNSASSKWEKIGGNEKVLFIVTEQNFKEVRKMILAYLTDMNESRFKYGNFNDDERQLLEEAKTIMEHYKDNFVLIKMPNPTIELAKLMIRENCLTKNIKYVFYDYIFISPSLLNEFKGFSLRNDEILLMFATALKDLAGELGVCVMTSTQVNANADSTNTIRNEGSLAGGRSTINKADNGSIMARPSKEELEILEPLTSKYGIPNVVTDIFKVRSGEWSQVRIWSIIDLGRMKREDLFITDSNLDPVPGFEDQRDIVIKRWDEAEDENENQLLKELNDD